MDRATLDIIRIIVTAVIIFSIATGLTLAVQNSYWSMESIIFTMVLIWVFAVSIFMLVALRIVLMIDYRAKKLDEISSHLKKMIETE